MALLDGPATNIRDALRNLDPAHSLNVSELETFYVKREGSPIERIAIALEEAYPQKLLFTGHRGNGKSTELAQLERRLEEEFFVVRYALKNVLDLYDLNYIDLLLSIVLQMVTKVSSEDVNLSKATRASLESLWSFGQEIEFESNKAKTQGAEASIGISEFLATFLRLGVRVKSEHATRVAMREKVQHRIGDLLEGIDTMSRDIEQKTNKKVLCIVEDLDKADLAEAKTIFYENGSSISSPELSIIYTFPVALSHSDEFMQIKNYLASNYTLPNFKLENKKGGDHAVGKEALKQLLACRVSKDLFEKEALDKLVEYSGGVPRQLIFLAREACLEARVDEADKVTLDHVIEAVARERQNFARMLSKEQRRLLKNVKQKRDIDQIENHRTLLHNLSVLEYSNHDIWYNVNPLVENLLDDD